MFKRSLGEITLEAVDTVLELIHSHALYRGKEWEAWNRTRREAVKRAKEADVFRAIRAMTYNKTRPWRHGGKRC